MFDLSVFSRNEKQLLVSLPYKVGMWVSYADDVDGQEDDMLEARALEACIKAVARLHDDKPFVKTVAAETLRRSEDWERWGAQAFHALSEVEAAMKLLGGHLAADQLENYKAMLMEIASVVAQASGEFDSFDEDEGEEGGFADIVGKIIDGFKGLSHGDENHPMNVSASEEAALNDLRAVLKSES